MEKIRKFKCGQCNKEVWDIWNFCPDCGTMLSTGRGRAEINLPKFRI